MIKNDPSITNETSPPFWLRVLATIIILNSWYLLVRSILLPVGAKKIGLSIISIRGVLFCVVIVGTLIIGIAWLYPQKKYVVKGYFFLRKIRLLIFLLGGFVLNYLLMWRFPETFARFLICLNTILFVLIAYIIRPVSRQYNSFQPIFMRKVNAAKYKIINIIEIIPKWVLIGLVALLPIIVTYILLYYGLQVRITDYLPTDWNDEVDYWHSAQTFFNYGFRGGYYGWDEIPAPATITHFGVHGPAYPLIYGSIASLIGWSSHLPLLINMGMITIALVIFMKSAELEHKQMILTGLLSLTLWPILIFVNTSSMESLNHAIGIILAGGFYVLIKKQVSTRAWLKIALFFFLILASFIRISWGILFFPLLLLSWEGKPFFRIAKSFFISVALLFTIMWLNSFLVPPTGNIVSELIRDSFIQSPQVLLDHVIGQLNDFVKLPIRLYLSLVVILQMIILICWGLNRLYSILKEERQSLGTIFLSLPLFNVYSLTILIILGLILYLAIGFDRIFFPALLTSSLLLIAYKEYKPVLAIIYISIVMINPFLELYMDFSDNFRYDIQGVHEIQTEIEKVVVFDEETDNAWCNTILMSYRYSEGIGFLIPSGIGISLIVRQEELAFPLKSKYVFLPNGEDLFLENELKLQKLVSLSEGEIYFNIDSGCSIQN